MPTEKYPHQNHRQRVRESFRSTPFSEMPDISILELLLFYAIPRKNTNHIASRLIEEYGSLANVLNTPYEELIKIDGMGESGALLLSVLPEISKRFDGDAMPVSTLLEKDELNIYIRKKLYGLKNEVFMVVCLDPIGRATLCEIVAEGNDSSVTVDKRTILETVFSADADSVILAHNHPNGEAAPSHEDIELTKEIIALLNETGIKLTDHIIVGKGSILSLASTEKFKNLFI